MTKHIDNLVSIIIPCYNSEIFVSAAINSALGQSYPHVEIVVIDDGSIDRTLEIVRSFGDRIKWATQHNQGGPAARNHGLKLSSGEYIKFLDADDVLLHDCIEQQINHSKEIADDRKAVVYGEAVWVDQNLQPIESYPLRSRQPDEDTISHILTACPLTTCPLHRRGYLLEVGGFDVTLPRGQEHDLHLRLVLAGVEFIYYSDPVYQYRNYEGANRISAQPLSDKSALVQYEILKNQQALIEIVLGLPLPVSVRRAIAQRYWKFGRGVLREGHIAAARLYFQAARSLDCQQCITGNAPYPELVRFLGPYWAEAIFTAIKQLKLKMAG